MAATLINFQLPFPIQIGDNPTPHSRYLENDLVSEFLAIKPFSTFKCINGEDLLIIEPGYLNSYDGPDITDCEIFIDGIYLKGKAECHIKVDDWYLHKHHNDPLYKDVILHILKVDPDGLRSPDIPTVVLEQIDTGNHIIRQNHCHQELNLNAELLRPMILKRWSKSVNRFYLSIIHFEDPKEILLLEGIKHLCGKGNRENGLLFSKKLLENIKRGLNLLSAFDDALCYSLEFHWNSKGIRPFKRIEHLIPQLKCLVMVICKNRIESPEDIKELTETVISSLKKICGKGTLVEILGNVMYPFGAALSISRSKFDESDQYLDEWKKLVLPYSYGSLERKFNPYFSRKYLKKFHILQGLIELERMYCRNRFCNICPFCGYKQK